MQAKFCIEIPPPKRLDKGLFRCSATGLATQTPEEREQLKEFLERKIRLFEGVYRPTEKFQHHIRLKNETSIKQRYQLRNPAMQAIIDKKVDEMLKQDIIEPSHSPWSSPIVIVKKKDGKHRFCINFRWVNEITLKNAYPLPQITTLDKLRGTRYLLTLDLKNGHWQIPLAPESRPKTAFTIPERGLFNFKVKPFGLYSAPAECRLFPTIVGHGPRTRLRASRIHVSWWYHISL